MRNPLLKRKCKCGNVVTYCNKYTLQAAIDNKSVCPKCTNVVYKQKSKWESLDLPTVSKMYLEEKMPIHLVASKLLSSYKAVRKCLMRNGVPLRKKNTIGLHKLSDETKKKISEAHSGEKNFWFGKNAHPNVIKTFNKYRKLNLGNSPEARKKKSITRILKGLSKGKNNPMSREEVVRKWINSNKLSPNKKEQFMSTLLEDICPTKYKMNVRGEVIIIGCKIPDFVCIDEKRIIEFYGDYWHKDDRENDRIDFFKKFGYTTLIVWEHELKDLPKLKEKILNFNRL